MLALVAFEIGLLLIGQRFVRSRLPHLDRLAASGLGMVVAHAQLSFWVNLLFHFASLRWASYGAAVITVVGLWCLTLRRQGGVELPPKVDRASWLSAAGILLWGMWILLIGSGVDFGKENFGLISMMLYSDILPGSPDFPGGRSFYHYGGAQFATALCAVFGFESWVSDDILLLALCGTPFVAYRWLAGSFFETQRQHWAVAMLAFFGTNIRLWFIAGCSLIYLFAGGETYLGPRGFEALRLATRDFDLNLSTALSHMEQLLHTPSGLGLPIYLMCLCLWIDRRVLDFRSKCLISLLLLAPQGLHREDLFCQTLPVVAISVYMSGEWRRPVLWLSLVFSLAAFLTLGGPISELVKVKLAPLTGNEKNAATQEQMGSQAAVRVGMFALRGRPELASLNIDVGKRKAPIWHPQIVLDLLLDYGPACLGLLAVLGLLVRWKFSQDFLLLLCATLPAWLAMLFLDLVGFGYKMDLQRICPYGLTIFLLCVSMPGRIQILRPGWVGLLVLSGLLAGLCFPSRNRADWWWYEEEHELIGKNIRHSAEYHPLGSVVGLHSGYTGMMSHRYRGETRLDKDVETLIDFDPELYKRDSHPLWIVVRRGVVEHAPQGSRRVYEGQSYHVFLIE